MVALGRLPKLAKSRTRSNYSLRLGKKEGILGMALGLQHKLQLTGETWWHGVQLVGIRRELCPHLIFLHDYFD